MNPISWLLKQLGYIKVNCTLTITNRTAGAVRLHIGNKHTKWFRKLGKNTQSIWVHKSKFDKKPFVLGNKRANLTIEGDGEEYLIKEKTNG